MQLPLRTNWLGQHVSGDFEELAESESQHDPNFLRNLVQCFSQGKVEMALKSGAAKNLAS